MYGNKSAHVYKSGLLFIVLLGELSVSEFIPVESLDGIFTLYIILGNVLQIIGIMQLDIGTEIMLKHKPYTING